MSKDKSPISTRLRKRGKSVPSNYQQYESEDSQLERREDSVSATSIHSTDNITLFSPQTDPDTYTDELHSTSSLVRGTEEERRQFPAKDGQERVRTNFGYRYNPRTRVSTFYHARVSAPIPSKRTRHQLSKVTPADKSNLLDEVTKTSKATTRRSTRETRGSNKKKLENPSPGLKDRSKSMALEVELAEGSTSDEEEEETTVPLPSFTLLTTNRQLMTKDKEKEYSRRQRRVFVHSRFVTSEETMTVAKTVYGNIEVSPSSRYVTSFKGNISNFRTRLKRSFKNCSDRLDVTKQLLLSNDATFIENHILAQINMETLKSIWDHWITHPVVNPELFYKDKQLVDQLKIITTKLLITYFRELYGLISSKRSQKEMKRVDSISRTLRLPDTSEFA